ncbi:hypothetical protein BU24DRAFT_424891 [Aaosphaeria arxii CBS 175.79]|uniref:Uncharacterized protein n=1 Tax=Aaosphaeria arxii CBS 175.79 TaxID=1450172 RepID=A0A6A5XLW2_9PLEO|nr:uncharacterized protein BU24DRAFT_424891 [Aaosphaeria arxii CBS 175.79]KAF2013859.1 hypothetical protein BU24DRAFT_424891 [Aaosphaeria arxii CBS 175.79]
MAFVLSALLLASVASAQFETTASLRSVSAPIETAPSRTSEAPFSTETLSIPTPTSNPGEPCAQLAELVLDGDRRFPAELVHNCLNSVPVDKDGDSKLLDELKILWEWQSDGGWLKKTPDTWSNGALDIEKELDNIKSNLDKFESEYAVQMAIQNITIRSGNFHFNYRPDITRMFRFWRGVGVMAISEDGIKLPKLYTESDALAMASSDATKFSEIEQINGQDAWQYLESVANLEQYLDLDARMANVFTPSGGESYGAFEVQANYHGAETEIKFKNGSSATFQNYARFGTASAYARGDFNETSYWYDVLDGASLFDVFCQGNFTGDVVGNQFSNDKNTTSFEAPVAQKLDDRPVHTGKIRTPQHLRKRQTIPETYPEPIVEDTSEVVAGYFLEGQGYQDVAVLKVISFSPEEDTNGEEFQATVAEFLAQAKQEKKTKLVIDLRENGGGMIQLYLDLFKQLFPKDTPYSGQYWRAQEQFLGIGDAVSKIIDENKGSEYTKDLFAQSFYFWAYWVYKTGKGEYFKSWDDFNGPVELNGDSFTTLMQWSLDNVETNVLLSPGFNFFNDSSQNPPFEAKNIVMLTDGLCGSACAAFAENMKNLAGVKTVVVGGRPENKPMQGVAGSKGGQVSIAGQFPDRAKRLIAYSATANYENNLNNTKVKDLAELEQVLIRAGDERNRVQVKEHLRKGDDTGTPLEFVYEAADCKIFYTAKTWVDPSGLWAQTWDAFNDDKKCVEGSTKHESSISGGFKPFGTGEVKDEDLPKSTPTSQKPGQSGKPNSAGSIRVSVAAFALVIAVAISMM